MSEAQPQHPRQQFQAPLKYDFGDTLHGSHYKSDKHPLSDITVTFIDEQNELTFYAHKIILATCSKFFAEKINADSTEIVVNCENAAQCGNVMCWIYCPSYEGCFHTVREAPPDFLQKYMDAAEFLGVKMHEVEWLIEQRNKSPQVAPDQVPQTAEVQQTNDANSAQ